MGPGKSLCKGPAAGDSCRTWALAQQFAPSSEPTQLGAAKAPQMGRLGNNGDVPHSPVPEARVEGSTAGRKSRCGRPHPSRGSREGASPLRQLLGAPGVLGQVSWLQSLLSPHTVPCSWCTGPPSPPRGTAFGAWLGDPGAPLKTLTSIASSGLLPHTATLAGPRDRAVGHREGPFPDDKSKGRASPGLGSAAGTWQPEGGV